MVCFTSFICCRLFFPQQKCLVICFSTRTTSRVKNSACLSIKFISTSNYTTPGLNFKTLTAVIIKPFDTLIIDNKLYIWFTTYWMSKYLRKLIKERKKLSLCIMIYSSFPFFYSRKIVYSIHSKSNICLYWVIYYCKLPQINIESIEFQNTKLKAF